MNTEIIKISELIDNPKNTRRHPEKQIKEFIRSIEMFGQVRPIVIDENNMVLIGHGLKKALETMGKEECSVLRKSNLTEAQKKKLLISDNKIYSLGVDDYDAIEDIIKDIGDFDIAGYDADILEELYGVSSIEEDASKSIVNESQLAAEANNINTPLQQTNSNTSQTESSEDNKPKPPSNAVLEERKKYEESKQEVGKFVICPSCGERIDL